MDILNARYVPPGPVALPPAFVLRPINAARYDEMRDVLPPAVHLADGFLMGEAINQRACNVLGRVRPTYRAFFARGSEPPPAGRGWLFWEASHALTVAEFRALLLDRPALLAAIERGRAAP